VAASAGLPIAHSPWMRHPLEMGAAGRCVNNVKCLPYSYDQFVSRFVPGRTNRVRALRADRDTKPAAERIVGNVKLSVTRGGAASEFGSREPRPWLRDEQRAKDREQRQVANAQGKLGGCKHDVEGGTWLWAAGGGTAATLSGRCMSWRDMTWLHEPPPCVLA
jgi:hypothetical protein